MSADVFVTTEMGFAGFLCYLFGDESLIRIELNDTRKASFTFHVPSLDAEEYLREYHAGQLAISDYKDAVGRQTQLGRLLRKLNSTGETVWEREEFTVGVEASGSRSDEWWAEARRASEQRRTERENRERQERRPQQHRRH